MYDDAESTDNYSRIYQYDPLGLCTWGYFFGASTTGWFANVFTAQSNDALAAVSFYSATPNSTYEVYTGSSVSGSKTLRTSGTLAVPGYHTVSLPTPVALSNGQTFVVFVKITTPGWNYPIPLETPVNKGGYSYSGTASATPGQSYVSSSGSSWTDLTTFNGDSEANVCLKAFTSGGAVDTVGPVCKAKNATVKKGNVCKLKFYVGDAASAQVKFQVKIKTLAGTTKKVSPSIGWQDANHWWTWSFTCTLKKGTYHSYVYAKDLSGNPQSKLGSAKLTVK